MQRAIGTEPRLRSWQKSQNPAGHIWLLSHKKEELKAAIRLTAAKCFQTKFSKNYLSLFCWDSVLFAFASREIWPTVQCKNVSSQRAHKGPKKKGIHPHTQPHTKSHTDAHAYAHKHTHEDPLFHLRWRCHHIFSISWLFFHSFVAFASASCHWNMCKWKCLV